MFLKSLIFLTFVIASGVAVTMVKMPKYLAVYYGWPSAVENSGGNVVNATICFQQFDLIVLGRGVWETSHGDNLKTKEIISNLVGNGKKVFGYVDLGVTTDNLSIAQMKAAVDGWYAMGITGIFWDDAGYDFGVTRERQSEMVRYCHSKCLNVIMNAWNPDHVLSGPNELNCNDIYLLESYVVSNSSYTSLTAWETKAKKCAQYQKDLGVKMACLTSTKNTDQFLQAWFATAMYNFDYFQSTDINYGAISTKCTFRTNPSRSYGTVWTDEAVTSNAEKTSFSRSTNAWKLVIAGDGASWGYGTFNDLP